MNKATIAALLRAGIKLPDEAKVLAINLLGVEEPPKPNKYGAKPKVYNGVRYASTAEADRAMTLDQYKGHGAIYWWIGQPRFRLGCPENVYVADFLVVGPKGTWVEDVKGKETAKFKKDKRLWMAYGPCDLWIIKGGKCVEVIEGKDGDC